MTHGSLFSGIGGFDLAAQWMGWENIFHCEWNEFGQKVLKYYWPEAISYADITKTDFSIHRGQINILTGGFPCQPYSAAGKRLGKEDDRHLWPEMLRAIREIQPQWVVGENVSGLVNWNGGMVFHEVQSDLEAEGYEVQPFLLPACAVNAPHRRDRIWFIAYAHHYGFNGSQNGQSHIKRNDGNATGQNATKQFKGCGSKATPFNTDPGNQGLQREAHHFQNKGEDSRRRKGTYGATTQFHRGNNWAKWPTQPPLCSGNDGLPSGLDSITFPKWRNESIKAGGNAIVPQVAHQIFKAIQQMEQEQINLKKAA